MLFSTVFALLTFAVALIVRQLTVREIWRLKAESLSRFYAFAVISPPLASLWLVTAALFPRMWLSPEAFAQNHDAPLHQLHLLGELTLTLEPGLAYAMALFLIVIAGVAVSSSIRGSWRVSKVIKQLDIHAVAPPAEQIALVNKVAGKAGVPVGLVMSDYPLAFVWGFRNSKLILSSGLLRTLNAQELIGVLEHEVAHHARRDNVNKLLLSLCSYSSLAFPVSRLLVSWRATEVEIVCDEVAAARTSEPLEIAEALVKLRRHTMSNQVAHAPVSTNAIASSFVSVSALTFQRRVDRLLALVDAPGTSPGEKQSSFLTISLIVCAAGMIALSANLVFAPLSVHHAAEALIRILK